MRRTLEDTRRTVRIVIDNLDRADVLEHGAQEVWTANVYLDGDDEPADAAPTFDTTPHNALARLTNALAITKELDDLLDPMPDNEMLRTLIRQAADSWSGGEIPDWRDNEYARGQVELIWNTCDVRMPDEHELETEDAKDRIQTWIEAEA